MLLRNQGSLRFLILTFCFALGQEGDTMGLPSHALLGDIVPKPLLRFALFKQSMTVRTPSMDHNVIHEVGSSGTSGS